MNHGNNQYQGVMPHQRPLRPQRTSGPYGTFDTNPSPPPPYTTHPTLSDSRSPSFDPPSASLTTANKGTTNRSVGMAVIFLVLVAQAAAFIFFYDLHSTIDEYNRIKEELKEERERWEKAREDRIPQGAFWDVISPASDCIAYGEREYGATLLNIPEDWTDLEACMKMKASVVISGGTVTRPYRCAYVEGSPHVHGYWMVDWNQTDCKPWYRDFHDTGCTNPGSGIRRIEAQIVGILNRREQDWRLLCGSTPMTWRNITYNRPTHCDNRRFGRKVAIWDIPDESCR